MADPIDLPGDITATDLDKRMAELIQLGDDDSIEIVDSIVDRNAVHGSNPELEDPEEVAKL